MAEETRSDITALTVQLLSAFVSNNEVSSENLADLIKSTRAALMQEDAAPLAEAAVPKHVPAVSVRKSLASPDHIISLIDGKPYKTLKRHLATNGLTPAEYRERYNLPKSYPLVAKNYSEARRVVAANIGLGRRAVAAKTEDPVATLAAAAPIAEAAEPAAPKARKAPATSAKKRPAKSNEEPATAPTEAAAPQKGGRKRLSIAASQQGNADAEAASPQPSRAAKATSRKATSSPKAKPASKPRSRKSAPEGAGADQGVDAGVQDAAEKA